MKINSRPIRLALALTTTAVVLGAAVSGATASTGAETSSERSQEAPGDRGDGQADDHGRRTHQSEPSDSGAVFDDDSSSEPNATPVVRDSQDAATVSSLPQVARPEAGPTDRGVARITVAGGSFGGSILRAR